MGEADPLPSVCDVAIVGAGPIGLTLANLLGVAGVRTVIIEQNASTVQEPRAVTMDDETLRTIQAAGLVDAAIADIAMDCGSYFLGPDGSSFAFVHPTNKDNGYPRRNSFSQIMLEATMRRGLERLPNVAARFSHKCAAIAEDKDGVALRVEHGGVRSDVRARFVVGCDGARSTVRDAIGATLGGSSFSQRWIVIDLGKTSEQLRQTRIFCDPARPGITLPGPHGIRRYEFMLHADEDNALAESEGFVRGLLASHGPDGDAPIVRSRVYAFHARVADRWQSERLFIAGDAAHLSPPFGGLGMNSGIKDAHNLAWKLVEVINGRFPQALLATYSVERVPHATALVQTAINIGQVMMPTSRLKAALIRNGLRLAGFIPPLQSYFAQMKYKPKPFYRRGFLVPDAASKVVGRLFPQPLLEMRDGGSRLLDDIVGGRFSIVAYGPEAERAIAALATRDVGLDHVPVAILPASHNPRDGTEFVSGRDVAGRLSGVSGGEGLIALLRPDRIVAVATEMKSPASVDDFIRAVKGLTSSYGTAAAAA